MLYMVGRCGAAMNARVQSIQGVLGSRRGPWLQAVGRVSAGLAAAVAFAAVGACDSASEPAAPKGASSAPLVTEPSTPATTQGAAEPGARPEGDLPQGLLLAYAQFEVGDGQKVLPKPGPARLEILTQQGGAWHTEVIEDGDSNVFHKALAYQAPGGPPGILTLGGTAAAVKLWRPGPSGFSSTTLWTEMFGGKWDRMRDGEIGDVYGDGQPTIVVATHDQGVVAALHPDAQGHVDVRKLGAKPNTFVHEVELGDVDGDGTLEVYATPSEPNKLEGGEQHGLVWRFIPKLGRGPEIAADLGNRHAKEILVADVDGDGRDELYVAVEALTAGSGDSLRLVEPVEIRRYDADTPPGEGKVVATLPDRLCRFLTSGDVNGDGQKTLVAAAYRSGVWMLTPPKTAGGSWDKRNIDRRSSGFEHAAVFADLDEDGKDELYVAADEQGELRRYTFVDGEPKRETIAKREVPGAMMTWNIMPVPVSILHP